jgi:hypothetical protein
MDMAIVELTESTASSAGSREAADDLGHVDRAAVDRGLTAYFVAEGAAPTQSEQTYDKVSWSRRTWPPTGR